MVGFRTWYVNAGGYRTKFVEAGREDHPVVVLLHDGAYGADGLLTWERVLPGLSEHYHVFAPDLVGWGGSDKVAYFDRSHYSFRIEQVARFCEVLAIDAPAHFIGSSFGGSLLLRAAVEAPLPWPFASAVSISGTGGPYRLPEGIQALADFDGSLEDARRLVGLLVEDVSAFEDHARRRRENAAVPGHWEVMQAPRLRPPTARAAQPSSHEDFLEALRTITVPVLLVEGTRDQLLERGWSQKLAGLSERFHAVTTESAHSPNIEKPDELLSVVLPFLRSQDRPVA